MSSMILCTTFWLRNFFACAMVAISSAFSPANRENCSKMHTSSGVFVLACVSFPERPTKRLLREDPASNGVRSSIIGLQYPVDRANPAEPLSAAAKADEFFLGEGSSRSKKSIISR